MALSFDLACSYCLMRFENKRERARFDDQKTALREAIQEAFTGKPAGVENESPDPELTEDDEL